MMDSYKMYGTKNGRVPGSPRDADTTDVRTPVHTPTGLASPPPRQESDQHRSNSGSNGHSDPQPRTRTKSEYLSGLSRGRTGRASRARDALGRGRYPKKRRRKLRHTSHLTLQRVLG